MGQLLSATYADLYDEFLEAEKPRVSAQGYTAIADILHRVLAWLDSEELDVRELSIQDAVRYQSWLSEYHKPDGAPIATGTMHNYLKAARRFFDFLVATERRASNPFRELRYPRLPDHRCGNVLSEAQMGRLLKELVAFDVPAFWHKRERRYRVHVIAEFLYATGLRMAEACSLAPADLDLAHRLVHLRAGKGGKPRTAFLTGYAAEVMAAYLATGRGVVMHRFVRSRTDTLFGADPARVGLVVNEELASVCASLGLPVITSHGFRHSLGTHLLRSGCDMRYIQAILGHETLGSTQVYTHVDKDDLKRSLDAYHPRQWHPRHTEESAPCSPMP